MIDTSAARCAPKIVFVVATVLLFANGCSSVLNAGTADLAGVAGAAVAGAVTTNPAVAAGIGFAAQAGARTGVQYAQRQIHGAAQDEIARVAGGLRVGAVGTWRTQQRIPTEPAEHGRVAVSRVVRGASFQCKEIVFSVDSVARDTGRSAYYVAPICREGATWKWAAAEPSTARWGALQ